MTEDIMRSSALFFITCLGLYTFPTITNPVQAEDVFKNTAFWLRGSGISVSHRSGHIVFSVVDKEGKAVNNFGGNLKTNIGVQSKLNHLGNGLYEAVLPAVTLEKNNGYCN